MDVGSNTERQRAATADGPNYQRLLAALDAGVPDPDEALGFVEGMNEHHLKKLYENHYNALWTALPQAHRSALDRLLAPTSANLFNARRVRRDAVEATPQFQGALRRFAEHHDATCGGELLRQASEQIRLYDEGELPIRYRRQDKLDGFVAYVHLDHETARLLGFPHETELRMQAFGQGHTEYIEHSFARGAVWSTLDTELSGHWQYTLEAGNLGSVGSVLGSTTHTLTLRHLAGDRLAGEPRMTRADLQVHNA